MVIVITKEEPLLDDIIEEEQRIELIEITTLEEEPLRQVQLDVIIKLEIILLTEIKNNRLTNLLEEVHHLAEERLHQRCTEKEVALLLQEEELMKEEHLLIHQVVAVVEHRVTHLQLQAHVVAVLQAVILAEVATVEVVAEEVAEVIEDDKQNYHNTLHH